jgi:exodeoxyribonuclease V alpha subunit
MKEYIKGKYSKTIFESEKGYIIGLMKVKDTNNEDIIDFIDRTITFTGYFPELKLDENYIFYGELVDHPKYGLQYQVTESKLIMPEDEDGIIIFLSSDLFKGIGEKLAKQIVKTLGKNCLEEILKNPSCLDTIPKLTEKKKTIILQTLNEYASSHQTIVYLTDLGFSMKDAMTIYNYYKANSIKKLEENPYQMIEEVEEISFLKIDKLYQKLNIEKENKKRIKACIFYEMKELLFINGDTYLYLDEIKKKTETYLGFQIEIEQFLNYIDELILEDKIVKEEDKYYTKEIYEAEEIIVRKMYTLNHHENTKIKNLEKEIAALEELEQIKYNDKQKEAIKKSLENNVVIITGGPGTGKTTIINAIVSLYSKIYKKENNLLLSDLALLAPTGRASKRMSQATTLPASTIHRFLKWDKDTNTFMVNEENKDLSKLIIVDEVSMLDTELMASLLKGLTNDIKFILVGDYNQLPSVGPGNVLKDLIDSETIETIHLDLLYRQSEESYIPVLAEEIKKNDLNPHFTEKKDDYLFLECSKDYIVPAIKKLCIQLVEKGYDEKRVALLAPMYAGVNGIDHLNKELQEIFNPRSEDKKEIKVGDVIYREHDKILQLANMPDENVFNGDIGFIEYIIDANKSMSKKPEIYVNFDGTTVKYLPKDMINIKHGFIMSIHKSQGSEFELVLMPVCRSYYRMLYRKLIYTGITRAKQKLILVGDKDAFLYAVSNTNEKERKTTLKEKLQKLYNF